MRSLPWINNWRRVPVGATVGLLVITAGAANAAPAESPATPLPPNSVTTVELPLLSGWYDGEPVYYVTTDVSQSDMARQAHANYAPRLRHALRPPVPGEPSAVDRVYKFSNFDQGSVFPSAPKPDGKPGGDNDYTPFWVVYMVTWLPDSKPHVLRSEQEIADAEEKKSIRIAPTDVVVNCPILFTRKSGVPDGIKVQIRNP